MIPLSNAQASIVRRLWVTGRWSVLEIARYLGVDPRRVDTGQMTEKRMPRRRVMDEPKIEVFYADPVDADGNVIGTATLTNVRGPWGPITPVKVPYDEIVLDPETTIHAKLDAESDRTT